MFERMMFAIVSSYEKSPEEKVVIVLDAEETAETAVMNLNLSAEQDVSPILGKASYRIAHVRITEMIEINDYEPLT